MFLSCSGSESLSRRMAAAAAAADGWLMTDDDGGVLVDGSSIDDYDAVLFVGG